MSITSSERPFDMSAWVSEKSDNVLAAACQLVDLVQAMGHKLSSPHKDAMVSELYHIIRYATQLSTFGHEKMDSFSREMVELMVTKGTKGFRTYKQYVSGTSALALSLRALERLLPLFDHVQNLLTADPGNQRLLRSKLEQLAKELCTSNFVQVKAVGDHLLKLLKRDDANTSSWSQLVKETAPLLEQGRQTVVRNADNARTALADLDAANLSLR